MAIKLHRRSVQWVKINSHPCWKAQKALDEQGIEYEVSPDRCGTARTLRARRLTPAAR